MDGHLENGLVRVGGDARQRFHDARGYGYPLDGGEIALAPVEAAHLLFRDDLEVVRDGSEALDFRAFLGRDHGEGFGARFVAYADLRARGFYLTPASEPWIDGSPAADFAVFPRGKGPRDGVIEYPVRVLGERTTLPAGELSPGVVAVVDEESEVTYLQLSQASPSGTSEANLPDGVDGDLLDERVVCWDAPASLYEEGFFGRPVDGRDWTGGPLQCSLVEAVFLAERGVIDLDVRAVRDRGRLVEGERFDRRLRVYETLRERGVVPKTGYKFGADFRTYADVTSVDELGHSELLVRVLPADAEFHPRDLALDVRLAHGVRKTMVFALVGGGKVSGDESRSDDGDTERSGDIEWWAIERLTP